MLFIETESACTHNINTDDNNDDYALDENVIKIEGRVRVMVSLNRQSHIVTGYGKFRNITLHDHPASNPKRRAESYRARSRKHPKGAPRFVDPK